jgi:hypothetical protein
LRVPAPRIASRRLVAAAAARPGAGAWETAAVSALPCPLLFTSALQGSCERERHEPCHGVRVVLPNGFIEPCLPSPAPKPPAGAGWIHEIKLDGFRLLARRDAAGVRLLTRRGIDWTNRYPTVAAAVAALAARIEAMARAPAPPPPQERPAAIARLEKELEQLQRVEEALITAAAERSEVVARSHDVPPWVLLGVRVAEKPKRAAE